MGLRYIKINQNTLNFLSELSENNTRDWFNENKADYLSAHRNMCDFIEGLMVHMNGHDVLENESSKKCLYRIYNDVRFSKDKSPYNPRFAFSLKRATHLRRGGYYVNIKPGNSYLACGFFSPNPEDLKRIRADINIHYTEWNTLLKSKKIKENFGEIRGKQVSSSPRGYSLHHPGIILLRNKQYILRHDFTDEEVLDNSFMDEVNRLFKSVRTFFNYMSEVLTTDLNGELTV